MALTGKSLWKAEKKSCFFGFCTETLHIHRKCFSKEAQKYGVKKRSHHIGTFCGRGVGENTSAYWEDTMGTRAALDTRDRVVLLWV